MRPVERLLGLLALAAVCLAVLHVVGRARDVEAKGPATADLDEETRRATFRFDPATKPGDRDAILAAVAAAEPRARRLIDVIDGIVNVRVAPIPDALGTTEGSLAGGYLVTLDLNRVAVRYGQRGVARVVLHELGHVVDFALLDGPRRARMDAATPAGWGCDEQGTGGSCAAREERFAESFSKWATKDIGVDLQIGYAVPPPDLDTWGDGLESAGT